MNRELDRLGDEAWDRLAGDVRSTGKRLGRTGASLARKHPAILVGALSLLAALAAWRLRRPRSPVAVKRRGIGSTLFRMARFGLGLAVSVAGRRVPERRVTSGTAAHQED